MSYAKHVKYILDQKIHELSLLKDTYCKRPGILLRENISGISFDCM